MLELSEAIEERDDVLQRLEDKGIGETNGLRQTIEVIRHQNEEYDVQMVAYMAEHRGQLVQMEAQDVEVDIALLDWEEKYQIELLEDQMLRTRLKETQEADTAIAAILAFAMVRSEGTATDLGRDLDIASAELGSDWSSTESEENVETIRISTKKIPLVSQRRVFGGFERHL